MCELSTFKSNNSELQAPAAVEPSVTGAPGKQRRTIAISWRDENYGRISNALAFRFWCDPSLSDTAATKLVRLFHRNGFSFNTSRDSWIAEGGLAAGPDRLIGDLQTAGYQVSHAGCVPPALTGAQRSQR